MMKNIFDQAVTDQFVGRINKLESISKPLWGKMEVAQMLAHCNVTYEMVYDNIHPKATGIKKFLIKAFVKNTVVSEKPYPRNSRTAPQFLIMGTKNFETEKGRLVAYLKRTQELGGTHFNGKESLSFGSLTTAEWNNMFAKHLEHHLEQFGV